MDEHEPEALVVFGNFGMHRHNDVNPVWSSQYLDLHHRSLVDPRTEHLDAALFVGLANHVPGAREDVPVIERARNHAADAVARRLSEIEADRGRVRFVGLGRTSGMGMPWQHSLRQRELLSAIDPGQRGCAVRAAAWARVRGGVERGAAELTALPILGAVVGGKGAESLRNVPFEPLIAG
ncbi:MAG: hypothetical protein ABR569_12745 [Gaiellaceae bacterium]